jgi:hypothetical protein
VKPRKVVAIVAAAAVVGAFAVTGVAGARVRHGSRGVTSDSIKIGGLTDPNQPEAIAGAKAALDAANDAGGASRSPSGSRWSSRTACSRSCR